MEKQSCREIISRVRGSFKLNSSDSVSNISDRMILSELESTAHLFIKQQTDARKLWNSANIFTELTCLKLQQVPLAECCSYHSECTIARSVVQLPKILEGNNFGMLIQGVYSIDMVSRTFIPSTPDRYINSLDLGLKRKEIHYWIKNKYLYIGDPDIERIRISAYFVEDIPEDLISYPSYCGIELSKGCCPSSDEVNSINDLSCCCPKSPYDVEFKAPDYLLKTIVDAVGERLIRTFKNSVDDKSNNALDETK